MENSRHADRSARRSAAATLSWFGVAVLCLLIPWRARADCIGATDPSIHALQLLDATDAAQAVAQAQARLAPLLRSAHPDAHLIASLDAVLAQSYSRLELDADARAAARAGLALITDQTDPVRVDLLAAYAENVYDAPGIRAALATIRAAESAQPPGSRAGICLRITQGLLEYRMDRADLAIVTLTQAYRASGTKQFAQVRMLAADALTAVMRSMGDYAQALELNGEVIAWDVAHGARLSLSVSKYVRGTVLKLMGDYQGAIDAFVQSRDLSEGLHDVQGIAFENLRICETRVRVRNYGRAKRECERALPTFVAAGSTDVIKETRAVLARIDLGQGKPARALAALDGVLDRDGEDLPPRRVAILYQWRARANAAMHHYRPAYADLSEYVRRTQADYDAARARQAAAMRARFETDREIERNVSLQRELEIAQERSQRQQAELKRNAVIFVSGLLVIAMLVYVAFFTLRHRRALLRLATLDGLTELPNRRRTAELATHTLQSALAVPRPLTLAIIDLDHFKQINDRCGHAAGDHVLREVARASIAVLRAGDVLGRWGGEEFLLVMPDTTLDAALAVLERLRAALRAIELPATGGGLQVSMSAGLATLDEQTTTLDELIARADAALYEAKDQGRNLVRIAERGAVGVRDPFSRHG